MIEILLLLSVYISGIYIMLRKKEVPFPFFLSIAVIPAIITVFLQYLLLVFPGIDLLYLKVVFIVLATVSFVCIVKNLTFFKDIKFCWDEIGVVLLCSYIFFAVNPQMRSFDPINYVLIGREIFQASSLLEYPFIEFGRSSGLFSWFAHPLMLPLSYSFLFIFEVSRLIPYVSGLYFVLTIVFVYKILKKESGYTVAIASALLLFFTPQFFVVARDGFTGPLRMFFFTAIVYYFFRTGSEKPFLKGMLTGFAMNTHLIGIIILPYAFFMHLKENDFKLKIKKILYFAFPVFICGGFVYLNNLVKFQSLDSTKYLISFYPDIAKEFINMIHTQYGVLSTKDRLINGYFASLMRPDYFSLSYILVCFFLLINGLKVHKNKFFISSAVLLAVYGVMHFNPSQMNGFIRGPRYVLTILPVLVILAGTLINSGWMKRVYVLCSLISVCVALSYSGSVFKQRPIAYEPMEKFISQNIPEDSRILTFRFPEVAYFNTKHVAVSEMDPVIADIYKMKDMGEFLSALKSHGISYILFGFYATPFETKTCISQLFETPGLLKKEFSTEHYYLFRIDYERYNSELITGKHVFVWNPGDNADLVLYKNGKTDSKLTLTHRQDMSVVEVEGDKPDSVFLFANGPSWEINAGYIQVKPGALLKIKMMLNIQTEETQVVPVVAQYDNSGKRIALVNGKAIERTGDMCITFQFNTAYPYIQSERLELKDNCQSVAIGLHLWSEGGVLGVKHVAIEE